MVAWIFEEPNKRFKLKEKKKEGCVKFKKKSLI